MRHQFAPVLTAAAIVGAAGVVYGIQTDRWRASPALDGALDRLTRLPPVAGNGRAVRGRRHGAGGIKGCAYRAYRNARTGETVTLLLVCGRGGPISVHTPDICYAAAGYRQIADARPKEVAWGAGQTGTFRVAQFAKPGAVPTRLEIFWAWSADGRAWQAPENPRWSLARLPALYKLYAIRQFAPGTREEAADPCGDFLRRALPEFAAALAPGD